MGFSGLEFEGHDIDIIEHGFPALLHTKCYKEMNKMIITDLQIKVECDSCSEVCEDNTSWNHCKKCMNDFIHKDTLIDAIKEICEQEIKAPIGRNRYEDAFFWLCDAFDYVKEFEKEIQPLFNKERENAIKEREVEKSCE